MAGGGIVTNWNIVADWIDGAVLYHIPSVSSVSLDRCGEPDERYVYIESAEAEQALQAVLADTDFMTVLRLRVREEWQSTDC